MFPGGTGQTEQQVHAMAELAPAGYIGPPSFLKIIVDKAADMGVPLPSVQKATRGGEAFPPRLPDWSAAPALTAAPLRPPPPRAAHARPR